MIDMKRLTVKELIEELQKMPQDLLVIDMSEPVSGCHVNHEYYDGDPCNPKCKVIEVVELD